LTAAAPVQKKSGKFWVRPSGGGKLKEENEERTEKSEKAYESVIAYIKKQILCGSLKQGEKLPPERELAEMLGVSRNSVREALRILEVLGAVTSAQGAGNYISGNFQKSLFESLSLMFLLQEIDYRQLSELRRGLEQQAIFLAVDNITHQQIRSLEAIVSAMAASEDPEEKAILDQRLHYVISLASGNRLIFSILQALSDVTDLFIKDLRQNITANPMEAKRLQRIHENMVTCIKNHDRMGACRAMSDHFEIVDEHIPFVNAANERERDRERAAGKV
jgi:GntR family transcriptional repressor for pyruvate dehydrogenase complex